MTQLYEKTLDDIFEATALALTGSWAEITAYYSADSERIYENALAYYDSADKYREGFFTKIPDTVLRELNRDILFVDVTFGEIVHIELG